MTTRASTPLAIQAFSSASCFSGAGPEKLCRIS